jgi:hypothetical protein
VQKPQKGDIVEFNLIWEIETINLDNTSSKGGKVIIEDEFLIDKSDIAIGIYNNLLNKMNYTETIRYKRKPNSQWITFYGKSKAFLVAIFNNDFLNIRLRLDNDYDSSILAKLPTETDKLSKSDNFLYSFNVYSDEDIKKVIPCIIDSYNYNGL